MAGTPEWKAALMNKVLGLVMKEGVFLFELVYNEVKHPFPRPSMHCILRIYLKSHKYVCLGRAHQRLGLVFLIQ